MKPKMKEIIGGKIYNTETAMLLADDYGIRDDGRNTYLYRTKMGNYFIVKSEGESKYLRPVPLWEALKIYDELPETYIFNTVAFGMQPEEA